MSKPKMSIAIRFPIVVTPSRQHSARRRGSLNYSGSRRYTPHLATLWKGKDEVIREDTLWNFPRALHNENHQQPRQPVLVDFTNAM